MRFPLFLKCIAGAFLAALLTALPALAQTTDLSGVWVGKSGLELHLVQEGRQVRATIPAGWPESEEPPGYTYFYGQIDGREFRGKLHNRRLRGDYTNTYRKAVCGQNWKEYVELKLTLSADGQQLIGESLNQRHDVKTCAPDGEPNWVPRSYTRKSPLPVTEKLKPAKPVEKPAAKPAAKPAELPRVETPPPPVVVPPPPAPAPVAPPAGGKSLLVGGLLLAALTAVAFFIRMAFVNYLVGSLKRSPNDAGLAGWGLFGGFVATSAIGSAALADPAWLNPSVLGILGGLAAACFGLCAMTARKR